MLEKEDSDAVSQASDVASQDDIFFELQGGLVWSVKIDAVRKVVLEAAGNKLLNVWYDLSTVPRFSSYNSTYSLD